MDSLEDANSAFGEVRRSIERQTRRTKVRT
jgi:hypothetical protein